MANELDEAIGRLCLAFPETERVVSHGSPNFRILRGKTFATYAVNHHGDGRIALWLNVADGMQDAYVHAEPKQFFVPLTWAAGVAGRTTRYRDCVETGCGAGAGRF